MRRIMLPALTAIALACGGSLAAQTASNDTMVTMSAEQHSAYDGWSATERAAYDAWPSTYQTYFWTLNPNQTRGWWLLSDEQRGQIYALTPEQRVLAWNSIEGQLAAAATPAGPVTAVVDAASPAAVMATPTQTVVSNVLPPPPASAMNKAYPICTSKLQDSCQNPGEGGAPGRRRSI